VFTRNPEGVRAFFRDVLGLPSVDADDDWPIFALPPAEVAAHPTDDDSHHELYLMCDNIEATVEELKRKGVEFTTEIKDAGWGMMTLLRLPDASVLTLYEPKHPSPLSRIG
jgi:catechol 2,3-dioxygenase-like lactoylglutathione lyase family enzyme